MDPFERLFLQLSYWLMIVADKHTSLRLLKQAIDKDPTL